MSKKITVLKKLVKKCWDIKMLVLQRFMQKLLTNEK